MYYFNFSDLHTVIASRYSYGVDLQLIPSAMAHYEDIIITDEGKTMCELCQVPITSDNIIEVHINSQRHQDLNMHRKMVQNNITVEKNRAYCLICREDLDDLTAHINTPQHQRIMSFIQNIVELDGAFIDLPQNIEQKGSKVNCTICNICVTFTLGSIKEHIDSDRHRRARSMAVQPFNGIFSVEDSDDDLWCKICQVYIENYIETIFEHVDEDKEHNTRLRKIFGLIEGKNITIDKYLTHPNEDKATCKKCNTGVACNVDNLERHIKGKRHNS